MAHKTMNDLLLAMMQDVYYAERQILKALPKLAKATESEELRDALMHHREETQGQVERLQKAFDALGKRARAQTCEAINGLIEEGDEIVEEFEQGPVRLFPASQYLKTPTESPCRFSAAQWQSLQSPHERWYIRTALGGRARQQPRRDCLPRGELACDQAFRLVLEEACPDGGARAIAAGTS